MESEFALSMAHSPQELLSLLVARYLPMASKPLLKLPFSITTDNKQDRVLQECCWSIMVLQIFAWMVILIFSLL
jgi:hypothetical protein